MAIPCFVRLRQHLRAVEQQRAAGVHGEHGRAGFPHHRDRVQPGDRHVEQ